MTRPSVGKASDTLSRRSRSHVASFDPVPLSLCCFLLQRPGLQVHIQLGLLSHSGSSENIPERVASLGKKVNRGKANKERQALCGIYDSHEAELRGREQTLFLEVPGTQVEALQQRLTDRDILQRQPHCVLVITVSHQATLDSRAEDMLATSRWERRQRIHTQTCLNLLQAHVCCSNYPSITPEALS